MRRYASTDRAVGTRSRTRRSASLADAGEPRSVQARSATREGSRAKGTAYQTGVWDPLIIAGPLVAQPDREVDHMVNMVK